MLERLALSRAHEHSRDGSGNRVMSPISATTTAPSTGPIPGSACTAR